MIIIVGRNTQQGVSSLVMYKIKIVIETKKIYSLGLPSHLDK